MHEESIGVERSPFTQKDLGIKCIDNFNAPFTQKDLGIKCIDIVEEEDEKDYELGVVLSLMNTYGFLTRPSNKSTLFFHYTHLDCKAEDLMVGGKQFIYKLYLSDNDTVIYRLVGLFVNISCRSKDMICLEISFWFNVFFSSKIAISSII